MSKPDIKENISRIGEITYNARIAQFAYTNKGYGHYCIVPSDSKKRAGDGVDYQVEVDMQYNVCRCWIRRNGTRTDVLCQSFYYGSKKDPRFMCKHMKAVQDMYAPELPDLRNEDKNPIVDVIRSGEWTKVRFSQLSEEEARAAYRSFFNVDNLALV